MVIEKGIVIRLGKQEPPTIWVKMVQGSACASCSERHSCNPMGDDREREVEVINTTGAAIGDRVDVAMDGSALLKATFLLYVFPIICMLIGAVAGDAIAARFHLSGSLPAVIAALSALSAALVVVKVRGNRLAERAAYRPQAIRVIKRELRPGDENHPVNCRSITPQE
jgi:sigma-E factor negative regulatory protein RseC